VLYWGLGCNSLLDPWPNIAKMIFAVLDASLIMGLNIGETDKVFTLIFVIIISGSIEMYIIIIIIIINIMYISILP